MSDEDIKVLIDEYGLTGNPAVMMLAREVERRTRHEFASFMQKSINAASNRELTAREFDRFLFNHSEKR